MRTGGRAGRGFTLVEILVAMTLTLAVFAITLPFVRAQTRALGASAGRLDADQVARYAQRAIDRDLRLASADPGQPLLVYAGPMGIAFNANLVAPDTTDPNASDVESGAPATLTESWALAAAGALPFGARTYPTQDYVDADGGASRNETIAYFLHPDTISGRTDLYVLYRRVNARDSVAIVRALQVDADSSFFSYYRPVGGTLARIADARLPLYWDSTAVDSITAVGMRVTGFYRERTTGNETLRTVNWRTPVPNAARRAALDCGDPPEPADFVNSTKVTGGPGLYRVEVQWDRSSDDFTGEADVTHYVVERQPAGGAWTALATVPSNGSAVYVWHHANPGAGDFTYGVRAVACGNAMSTRDTDSMESLP